MTSLHVIIASVAALLYKPVDRVTRSTLVLHVRIYSDALRESSATAQTRENKSLWNISSAFILCCTKDLLKHTPSSHPDHPLLQDALRISQNFLSSINEETAPRRQLTMVKKGEVSLHNGPNNNKTSAGPINRVYNKKHNIEERTGARAPKSVRNTIFTNEFTGQQPACSFSANIKANPPPQLGRSGRRHQ